MTVTRMRDILIVTLVTVLCSSAQARSISKELLELNSHINTQFGFDYADDAEFFSLIGVEVKEGDSESESYSYEYYDYVPFDKNRKESGIENDKGVKDADANRAVEEADSKKIIQAESKGKEDKGRIVISKNDNSDEYDENGIDYVNESQENDENNDNPVLVKSKEAKHKTKDIYSFKNDKDDNYVNDYDETHEIISNEDNSGENETEGEEEEDYDEDYDYEGDESEERNEQYYDDEEEEENSEEYVENNEGKDDYNEDYDYSEEKDNEDYGNANEVYDDGIVYWKKHRKDNGSKNEENNEDEDIKQNTSDEAYVDRGEITEDEGQNVSNDARKNDYSYEDYDNYNDY